MSQSKKRKVLLLTPPFEYFPNQGIGKRAMNYARPPLGISYLASYLRENAPGPIQVRIADGMLTPMDRILAMAREFSPQVIGISVTTANVQAGRSMAAALRRAVPGARLVAGGPHACTRPADVFPEFDLAVVGEGEKALLEIVERADEPLAGMRFTEAVQSREQPDGTITPRRIESLDQLPFPARDLLEMDKYYHTYPHRRPRGRYTTLFTSRGCQFHCSYCGSGSIFPGKKRYFSLDYVKEELRHVVEDLHCSLVFFDDDELLLDSERVHGLCEFLLNRRFPLRWICHSRPEGVDKGLFRLMKRAGCVEIQVGVESGSQDILRRMHRSYDTGKVRQFFRETRRAGIRTWATYVLGHPGETLESLQMTLRLALETEPSYASFIMLLPFPGTEVYEELRRADRLLSEDWSRYSFHSESPIFQPENLSIEELVRERAHMYRAFFLRPRKLARIGTDLLVSGGWREMTRSFLAWRSMSRVRS